MTQEVFFFLPIEEDLLFFIQKYSSIKRNFQKENKTDVDLIEDIDKHRKNGLKKIQKWNLILI